MELSKVNKEVADSKKVKLKISLTGIEFEALGYCREDVEVLVKKVLLFIFVIGVFTLLIRLVSTL